MKKPSYILMASLVCVFACTPESLEDDTKITSETVEQIDEESIKKKEIKDTDI